MLFFNTFLRYAVENFDGFDGRTAKNRCFVRFFDKKFSTFPTPRTVENEDKKADNLLHKVEKLYLYNKDFSQLKRRAESEEMNVCRFGMCKIYEKHL